MCSNNSSVHPHSTLDYTDLTALPDLDLEDIDKQ